MSLADLDATKRPSFVSTQVSEADRYYLDLAPKRSAPLTVVCGGCERLRADYVVERKTFPYLCVEFVAEGAGTIELRGKRYPLRPGMAFAYAPRIAHRIRNEPATPMRKFYVDFVGSEASRLLAATPLGKWVPAQIASPEEVLEIFSALQRDAFAEDELRAKLCAAHLRVLLLKIRQKAVPPQSAEPRAMTTYQRARRHIEENYLRLETAEDVARATEAADQTQKVNDAAVAQRQAELAMAKATAEARLSDVAAAEHSYDLTATEIFCDNDLF